MKILYALILTLTAAGIFTGHRYGMLSQNQREASGELDRALTDFDKAVEIIKKYETLHQPKHWPLVGYGHKVLPGEKFSRTKTMSEEQAEELLRKDLLKNCAVFRSYGADSLLLGVLAYNIGSGNVKKSTVAKKLQQGDRDIYENYVAFSKYNGKTHRQLKNRRIEEFEALFIEEINDGEMSAIDKNESDTKLQSEETV